MTRYMARIAYDGSQFSGFQRQSAQRTVQEELEKTLTRLNSGQKVVLQGAGRTDAGVHAYGQVIHFDLPDKRDLEKLRFALDSQSPDDIAVREVCEVSEDFHVRYAKHSKTYEFLVDISRPKNPLMRHYATPFPYQVDIKRMQEAIQDCLGCHDFTGFTASGTSVKDKVRTITRAEVIYDDNRQCLVFTFSGNGFLYKQVRNMVGTLLKIGNHKFPIDQIRTVITAKNRQLAGPTAPPQGLYLKEIHYDS